MSKWSFCKWLCFIALPMFFAVGCSKKSEVKNDNPKGLPSSGGKTLEVLVIVPEQLYKGELKDSIGHCFMKACEGLPQAEPLFDVVQMNPEGFFNSEMLQKHRNIIVIDMKAGNANKLKATVDFKSTPQAYFLFETDNRDSLFALLSRNADKIRNQFYENERKRVYSAFKRLENTDVTRKMKKRFGFWLTVSEEFYIAADKSDFMWLRKETKDESLDIMICTKPYSGKMLPSQEEIIAMRDSVAKANIPGPAKDSYMGTETRSPFYSQRVSIGGFEAEETRGLWRLFGDWMGGPFVNYCFIDELHGRLVMIDCFVYCPRHPKRDRLMQLEGIVYGLKTVQNE